MSQISIIERIYDNPETGDRIPYKRLAISGEVGGEMYTLELKLQKTELMGAQMILANAEDGVLHVVSADPFNPNKNGGRSDGKIDLEEED